jgi:hypothetical protein
MMPGFAKAPELVFAVLGDDGRVEVVVGRAQRLHLAKDRGPAEARLWPSRINIRNSARSSCTGTPQTFFVVIQLQRAALAPAARVISAMQTPPCPNYTTKRRLFSSALPFRMRGFQGHDALGGGSGGGAPDVFRRFRPLRLDFQLVMVAGISWAVLTFWSSTTGRSS